MLQSLRAAARSWPIAVIAPDQAGFLERVRALGCEGMALAFPAPLARFGEASATRAGAAGASAAAAGAAAVYVVGLRRTLRRFAPDIVHAHGIKMQVLSRLAAPRGARVIWHLHDYVSGRASSRRALRAASGRCAAAIANSRSVADDFRLRVGAAIPVSVMYNGVDLERFAPDGDRLDLDALARMPAAEPGTARIGLPATFGRWKGHDVFLRALRLMSPGTDWRAYIIGAPVYRTRGSQWSLGEAQAIVGEYGLADRVGFTGLVDDMPAAMRSLDIVVHASTHPEPFGMTIAEAMACGRATVASLAGGVNELVHDGADAVGCAPGDAAGLAAALSRLLVDPARRARLGAEARRTAEASFDARRLGPELRRVYESLAAAD